LINRRGKNINTAGIECSEARFSANKVQRCALARAGFSKSERTVVEVERGECTATISSFLFLAPVHASGNHEMKDQPEIVVKTASNALAHASQGNHLAAL